MKLLHSLAAAAALSASVLAQAPNVAIVAAASASLTDCRYTDVESYLTATGSFSSVTIVDCTSTTPSAADLAPYDAVLTWTNVNYADPVLLGDAMADYVDAGGAVVVAVFANTSTGASRSLQGRWLTGGYEIIMSAQGGAAGAASMGTILDPTHPVLQGVSTLTATSAFRPSLGTPLVQGSVIAEWDDGATLVAVGTMPERIDLGLYPPSSNCSSAFWDTNGDGNTLVANSLIVVSGGIPGGIGTPYCPGVVNSTGVPGNLGASGSTLATMNSLTLLGSGLPANAFSFFIVSQSQGFVMNPGGSTGNLCLGGAIGRYVGPGQIQQANASGETSLALDLTMTPTPGGFVSVAAGETWNYQAWYRDSSPAGPTSNFTNGYSIGFN